MAEFQHMNGSAVTSPLTAVTGNALHLKVVPGAKEALPAIDAAPVTVAKMSHLNPHTKANFATFHLDAVAKGKAILKATGGASYAIVAGPIDIVVEDPVALPAALTNAGLLVRVFLAEVPSPDQLAFTKDEAIEAMSLMRVVLENRLAKPSGVWGSAGAKTLADVVKSKKPVEQFKGFTSYPTLTGQIKKNIDDAIGIANDGGDTRRASYKRFVDAALSVAALAKVTDPTSKGLFWWRTSGHGKPSGDVSEFKTKLGNTFFTP